MKTNQPSVDVSILKPGLYIFEVYTNQNAVIKGKFVKL